MTAAMYFVFWLFFLNYLFPFPASYTFRVRKKMLAGDGASHQSQGHLVLGEHLSFGHERHWR